MIWKHSHAVATNESILMMTTLNDNSRDLLPAGRYCTWLFVARSAMGFSLRWHLARAIQGCGLLDPDQIAVLSNYKQWSTTIVHILGGAPRPGRTGDQRQCFRWPCYGGLGAGTD
jgi:hypothetical protein